MLQGSLVLPEISIQNNSASTYRMYNNNKNEFDLKSNYCKSLKTDMLFIIHFVSLCYRDNLIDVILTV